MELFTLDRNYQKQQVIDNFASVIWTERYYGDSEVELVTPLTPEMVAKLPKGTFLGMADSNEIMILETANMEDNKLKLNGISLLSWMDNRFVRATANHEDRYMQVTASPGEMVWDLLYWFTNADSPYLNGTIDIGIPNPEQFVISGIEFRDLELTLPAVTVAVPYGPLYKAMKDIATTYEIGINLWLEEGVLKFRSYKGADRTSDQSDYPVVRFSPDMESFTNIKEIQSIAQLKTEAFAFAPSNPNGLATTPGSAALSGDQYTGFDLRAIQVFAEDITTDQVGSDPAVLLDILNSRAQDALVANKAVQAVDGEIVPESQLKYGTHYYLGDIIEVQGNSGTINAARVTEYIRSQDSTGEKAYPTVSVID